MATRTINISLNERLVKEIDKAAYTSRSDYIRNSVVEKISAKKRQDANLLDKHYESFKRQYGKTLKNLADQ